MVKLAAALILVFVIEVSLVFFGGTDYNNSAVYDFLMAPNSFTSAAFIVMMTAILVAAAAAYIVPGAFYQINQWALFAGAAALMLTYGLSITHFWAFLAGQLGSILDVTTGNWVASLITAPILIFYVVTVIEWSRGNT